MLHQAFLRLSQSSFVKNLLGNVPGGRVPSEVELNGGKHLGDKGKKNSSAAEPSLCSFYSLQILAFWLSWVRKLYTQKGELRLSHEILGTLQQWSLVDKSMVTSPDEIEPLESLRRLSRPLLTTLKVTPLPLTMKSRQWKFFKKLFHEHLCCENELSTHGRISRCRQV